jgi:hypothetical protein
MRNVVKHSHAITLYMAEVKKKKKTKMYQMYQLESFRVN